MRAYQGEALKGLGWFGAAESWVNPDGTVQFCRFPRAGLDYLDKSTVAKLMEPSGVRLRFRSATRRVVMEVVPDATAVLHFDLVVDGKLHQRVILNPTQGRVAFDGLDGGAHEMVLWLNWQYRATKIISIAVDEGAEVLPAGKMDKPVVVFHGSSITHGRVSDGPTETWSSVAGAAMGAEPINLGLGGSCFGETVMAQYLRGVAMDYLVFCLGINVVGAATHSDRGMRMSLMGFMRTLREARPTLPVALMSPIFAARYEKKGNLESLSLERSREVVLEVAGTFQKNGDKHVMYVDGLTILGAADEARLFDGIHPDPEGQRIMGRRFAEKVWPVLREL